MSYYKGQYYSSNSESFEHVYNYAMMRADPDRGERTLIYFNPASITFSGIDPDYWYYSPQPVRYDKGLLPILLVQPDRLSIFPPESAEQL